MGYISGYSRKKLNAIKDSISIFDCQTKAVEQGCFYTLAGILTVPGEESIFVCGLTGNNKNIYMTLPSIDDSEPNLEIYAYKDLIYDDESGVALIPENHNHQMATNTAWQDLRLSPTISDNGTQFYIDFIPGTSGFLTSSGSKSSPNDKYKFATNTTYSMELRNLDESDNKLIFRIKWYELEGSLY